MPYAWINYQARCPDFVVSWVHPPNLFKGVTFYLAARFFSVASSAAKQLSRVNARNQHQFLSGATLPATERHHTRETTKVGTDEKHLSPAAYKSQWPA